MELNIYIYIYQDLVLGVTYVDIVQDSVLGVYIYICQDLVLGVISVYIVQDSVLGVMYIYIYT